MSDVPLKLGILVRFVHQKDGGPVHRIVSVMQDGMVEIHDMGGYFAPHLFAVADDIGGIPEPRTELSYGAKPLTNYAFAAYAARLAHKSATWAADTLQTMPEDILDPIRADVATRYLREIRGLLDHIERQVRRP